MNFTNVEGRPLDGATSVDVGDKPVTELQLKELDNSGPEDNDDTNDGSDTARVVSSATAFASKCLKTESYEEALVALRSALEIASPSSISYRLVVMHSAQLLKVTSQHEASIQCMLSIYQSMPPAFSRAEGICIIARQYEEMQSLSGAKFWWKKLGSPFTPNSQLWEAMGDRFFSHDLYVFAADCYAQALKGNPELYALPSLRFRYRYLTASLEFVGPLGQAAHLNALKTVAWSLAQWFRRRNGTNTQLTSCYEDPYYYLLRSIYSAAFPGIYRIAFAWIDGPAGRIARWWRRYWAKKHPQRTSEIIPGIGTTKKSATSKQRQPRSRTRITNPGKLLSPLPAKKPYLKKKIVSEGATGGNCGMRQGISKKKKQKAARKSTHNESDPVDDETPQPIKSLKGKSTKVMPAPGAKNGGMHDDLPTKRKFPVVRRLRTKQISGSAENNIRPASAGDGKTATKDEEVVARAASATSLLDVYSLHTSSTEEFVASCGRQPSFADLDLDEVQQFARLAHYRARVLSGQHSCVEDLDTTKVMPQWQIDLDRAMTLVKTQQQRNLLSGKVVVEDDSVAHLAEVHTRIVLQLSALGRQYTREFGETQFTQQLRKVTRRLVEWKFLFISHLVDALDGVKSTAMKEEKQRNLEFYHVHRGGS